MLQPVSQIRMKVKCMYGKTGKLSLRVMELVILWYKLNYLYVCSVPFFNLHIPTISILLRRECQVRPFEPYLITLFRHLFLHHLGSSEVRLIYVLVLFSFGLFSFKYKIKQATGQSDENKVGENLYLHSPRLRFKLPSPGGETFAGVNKLELKGG